MTALIYAQRQTAGEHVLSELTPLAPAFSSEVKGPRPGLQVSLSLKLRSLFLFVKFLKGWFCGLLELWRFQCLEGEGAGQD